MHGVICASTQFTNTGLLEESKTLIEQSVWYTGIPEVSYEKDNILASQFYDIERNSKQDRICFDNPFCNDNITRTMKWKGYIGLLSASDYGYSVGSNEEVDRNTCLNIALGKWNQAPYCYASTWHGNSLKWTMNSVTMEDRATKGYIINHTQLYSVCDVYGPGEIFPTLYLKSSVKISSGDGSVENPYILSL